MVGMVGILRNALFFAPLFSFIALGDTGEYNNEHETLTNESKVHFYDWREDVQYGDKINRIIQALDLSEFHSIIARLSSPEHPDDFYIVTSDSLEDLPASLKMSLKMYYSLEMQDGKMYSFPRVILGTGTPHDDVSNQVLIKGFQNIGESVWTDGINNKYLVSDVLIDIENSSESPIILLRYSLTGNEGSILPIFECNNELYVIIHESNIYIPPMSTYRLQGKIIPKGKIIPHPANQPIEPSCNMHVMTLPEIITDVSIELYFQSVIIGNKLRVKLPQKFIYRYHCHPIESNRENSRAANKNTR